MGTCIDYQSPLGLITITEDDGAITNLYFGTEAPPENPYTHADTPILIAARDQLIEYFAGKRKEFDLPLAPKGTDFMQKDWNALCEIPYGEIRTYKDVATALGNAKACRAVGLANNRNPIAIIIPCHRVIGSNGKLVGYAGGLHLKEALLKLERENI